MQHIVVKNEKKKKLNLNSAIGFPYIILLITLIVAPLFIMVLYSFQEKSTNGLLITEFSIEHYSIFFRQFDFLKSMGYSILLAVIATAITILLAYPTAYFLSQKSNKIQTLVLSLITGTMWINMILRTNAIKQILMMLNEYAGINLLETNTATVIGLVYMFFPYMFLPIYTVISKLDTKLIEAAKDLGANRYKTFIKVVLPLSVTGIISGIIMVLLPATTTIVVPAYLGPTTNLLIGQLIESRMLASGSSDTAINSAAAISVILGVIMIIMMVLINKADPRKRKVGDDNE